WNAATQFDDKIARGLVSDTLRCEERSRLFFRNWIEQICMQQLQKLSPLVAQFVSSGNSNNAVRREITEAAFQNGTQPWIKIKCSFFICVKAQCDSSVSAISTYIFQKYWR